MLGYFFHIYLRPEMSAIDDESQDQLASERKRKRTLTISDFLLLLTIMSTLDGSPFMAKSMISANESSICAFVSSYECR